MSDTKINTLVIATPEGISFALPLAGPAVRFFAWAVDLACIIAVTSIISTLLFTLSILSPSLAGALSTLAFFAVSVGYGMFLEWFWRGQTLGKRLLKLRVMDEQGLKLQPSQVVVRNLLRFVDALPLFYLVGGISCLVSKKAQRLGDYAANTVVVRIVPGLEYDLSRLAADKYNSFRDYPSLEARLKHLVSAQEADLAFRALLRREELAPQARVQLMKEFAGHFRALVPFPEEAVFGLTDEQYVKNVVDSLFRGRGKQP